MAMAAIVAMLMPPLVIAGESEYVVKRPAFAVGFVLRSSNGYSLGVTSEDHRRVILTARKGLFYSATYSAPGRASSKGYRG